MKKFSGLTHFVYMTVILSISMDIVYQYKRIRVASFYHMKLFTKTYSDPQLKEVRVELLTLF